MDRSTSATCTIGTWRFTRQDSGQLGGGTGLLFMLDLPSFRNPGKFPAPQRSFFPRPPRTGPRRRGCRGDFIRAGPNQLSQKGRRQGPVGGKTDCAFPGIVPRQLAGKCRDDSAAHRIIRTMSRSGCQCGKRFSIEAKSGGAITDAFLRPGSEPPDRPPHFFQRRTLLRTGTRQTFVKSSRPGNHRSRS